MTRGGAAASSSRRRASASALRHSASWVETSLSSIARTSTESATAPGASASLVIWLWVTRVALPATTSTVPVSPGTGSRRVTRCGTSAGRMAPACTATRSVNGPGSTQTIGQPRSTTAWAIWSTSSMLNASTRKIRVPSRRSSTSSCLMACLPEMTGLMLTCPSPALNCSRKRVGRWAWCTGVRTSCATPVRVRSTESMSE